MTNGCGPCGHYLWVHVMLIVDSQKDDQKGNKNGGPVNRKILRGSCHKFCQLFFRIGLVTKPKMGGGENSISLLNAFRKFQTIDYKGGKDVDVVTVQFMFQVEPIGSMYCSFPKPLCIRVIRLNFGEVYKSWASDIYGADLLVRGDLVFAPYSSLCATNVYQEYFCWASDIDNPYKLNFLSVSNICLVITGFFLTCVSQLQDYGIDFDDDSHPVKAFRCRCGSKFCRNMKRSTSEQCIVLSVTCSFNQ